MVLLALECEEHLRASRVELDREGPSYTADTLRQLREAYGESARLYFICGADALSELETWYRPEVLLANASVAVARRAGCEASSEIPAVAERLTGLFGGHVVAFDAPLVNVSSTLIRNLVRKGQGAGQYLPAAVYQYVLANGLYLEGNCF
jgi:nicotinate-nucleotide adenylyltransferase